MKCHRCEGEFQPKPMGFNAKYCSTKCCNAARRGRLKENSPETLQAQRARKYARTKADSERYGRHLRQSQNSLRKSREWLAAYKMERGCVDCGYRVHWSALQLDHEGPKSVEISSARSSIARLQKEIENGQCKVRCANCHSIRTWGRKQKSAKDSE